MQTVETSKFSTPRSPDESANIEYVLFNYIPLDLFLVVVILISIRSLNNSMSPYYKTPNFVFIPDCVESITLQKDKLHSTAEHRVNS